jgi:hypothetical protein
VGGINAAGMCCGREAFPPEDEVCRGPGGVALWHTAAYHRRARRLAAKHRGGVETSQARCEQVEAALTIRVGIPHSNATYHLKDHLEVRDLLRTVVK